jgi:quercetin dioxygenase-like cupin family protein
MNARTFALTATFGMLALGAAGLDVVASVERSPQLLASEVVRAGDVFGGLEPCDVPGVREHVLGRGTATVAYAGEFSPTSTIPWTRSTRRMYLYVLSGSATLHINSLTTAADPGDFFVIPKGARHAVVVNSGLMRAIYVEDRS